MHCPPSGHHASVMQQSLQGPSLTAIKVISRKGGHMSRLLKESWPTAMRLLPRRSSAVTDPWREKCYICSILALRKKSKAETLSRWLPGKVCEWWSQYQARAAVQTSATDLMDEVSHTHLQREHSHLREARTGQAQWATFMLQLSGHPLRVRALFSTLACSHLLSIWAPVFSLGRLLTAHFESSTCFSKTQ